MAQASGSEDLLPHRASKPPKRNRWQRRLIGPAALALIASVALLPGATKSPASADPEVDTLVFVAPPASAQKNAVITSSAGNPAGPPITVGIDYAIGSESFYSGSVTVAIASGPAGAVLSGTLTQPLDSEAGVATFADLSINTSGVFTLAAVFSAAYEEGAEPDPTASPAFTIWDTVTSCPAGRTCASTVSVPNVMSTQIVGKSSTAGAIVASLSVDSFGCGDTANHAPRTTTFDTFNFTSTTPKLAIVKIDRSIVNATPNNGASKYQVCYQAPTPFKTRAGTMATTGLLPDCWAVRGAAPCVVLIAKSFTGSIIETLLLPPGDPKFR